MSEWNKDIAGGDDIPGLQHSAGSGSHDGSPSRAYDCMEPCIDLNKELVRHPAATFYGRVAGDSMADAGFGDGDILVIDRSLEPADGKLAVCFLDGEFTLRRLSSEEPGTGRKDGLWLVPVKSGHKPVKVDQMSDFSVWGIVTYIIRKVC